MPDLSDHTKQFFRGEIANERDGGVSPATVRSAIDSYLQAPDVFFPGSLARQAVTDELLRLVAYEDALDADLDDLLAADNTDSVKSTPGGDAPTPEVWFAWYVPDSDGRLLVPRANPNYWEQPADLLFNTKTEALNWRDEEEGDAADEGDEVELTYIRSWVLCERRLTPILSFIERTT